MKRSNNSFIWSAVFFSSIGWVYNGPAARAAGDDEVGPVIAESDSAAVQSAGSLFETQSAVDTKALEKAVKVGSFGQIDLHVKDQELSTILQLLSIQSQRNIIVSKGVSGAVTADLYGVDFYQAMDAVLHPNGYGYREKGNFIYVYTADQIKALDEADRKTSNKVVRLQYLTAADAATFVTPLLSSAGSIALSGNVKEGFAPSTSDGGANSSAHSDTLIIKDYPENMDQIMAVLQELDTRPKQVLIEATILEAKLTENNAWGINLTVLADFGVSDFVGGPLSVINSLKAGTTQGPGTAITSNNIIANESSVAIGVLSDEVAAFVEALDKVTDTTILANPKLLVLNRQRADLLVGQRIGYVSTTQTESSTTQTVDFLETGTQLTVRPFVSDDGFVRMEIRPQISTGEVRQIANFVVPNEDTQTLTTNVMVRNGQTVVLGGLFKESTTVSRKQVPFFGDIPLLGNVGKGRSDTVNRDEFIFLITPTIVKDEAIYAAGERANDSVELARIGARQELLPWSRSKMTSSHLRDAIKAMEEGKKDKALWSVNMALTMDPTFVEARRLKEQLTGQRTQVAHESVLKDAVNVMIDKQLEIQGEPMSADQPKQPQAEVHHQPEAQTPAADAAQSDEATIAPAADME